MFFENNKILNILRIAFIAIFMFLITFAVIHPAKTETNILKAVFADKGHDNVLVDLSNKYSSKINIIVEAENSDDAENFSKMIFYKLDKTNLKYSDIDPKEILDTYAKYQNNLLSKGSENLLKNKDYDAVKDEALVHLYNPAVTGFNVAPLEKDPFMLVTDFVLSLAPDGKIQLSNFTPVMYENKYFSLLAIEVNQELGLSPVDINREVKKLIDIQKEFSHDGLQVYLTGTPIHSYFASIHSVFEINLICIVSIIFIISLVLLYFRSLRPLIPILMSISLGISAGYLMTSAVFSSIHILTFVFSSALIGICIDYSLHFFVAKAEEEECICVVKEIFKSISVSLFTTVCAFLVLMLADFSLLKQISVFTITGLVTVYLFVVLFYPLFCKNMGHKREHKFHFRVPDFLRIPILGLCVVVGFLGVTKLNYDDNIKNLYTPPKDLLKAEIIYKNAFKPITDISFVVVNAQDTQSMLEIEEQIGDKLFGENIKYQALSRFIPSIKQQKINQNYRKILYEKELSNYGTFLPLTVRNSLINQKYNSEYLEYNECFGFLDDFLINKNTSVMVVYQLYDHSLLNDIHGIKLINLKNDISNQIKQCRRMCFSLLIPMFLFIYLILAKIYDFKSALQILTPSILASIFTLGFFGILNQSINLFHVLAVFLIIGFGLDYSVFRFCGSRKSEDAIFISCLTTVFSFTLLAFTGFRLISSLAMVLALGLISSYLLSLICIPEKEQNN